MKKSLMTLLQIAVTCALLYVVLSRVAFYGRTYERAEVLSSSDAFVTVRLDAERTETFPVSQVQGTETVVAADGARRTLATVFKPGLFDVLAQTDVRMAVGFGLLAGLVVFFTSLRLYLLLRVQKFDITLGETIRFSFIGIFFNWVLPGLVTGDLVKWYFISKKHGRVALVGILLALDRIIGAFVLFLIASAVSLFVDLDLPAVAAQQDLQQKFLWIVWFVRIATLGAIAGGVALFSRRLHRLLRLDFFYRKLPGGRKLERLHEALLMYRTHAATLAVALIISVGVHTTTITCNFGLGRAMGIEGVSFLQYAIFVPVIFTAVGVIPLSLGGLGLRESMYVLTLRTVNIAAEKALNLSFTFYAISILWSLPGAVFYLAKRDRVSAGQMERELAEGGGEAEDWEGEQSE